MDAERWQRVEQLCQAALEREPGEQGSYLDKACAGDPGLRREVESLLAQQVYAEKFLETPAMDVAARGLARERCATGEREGTGEERPGRRMIGRRISHYQIVEKLASGGMGEIYLAVRADEQYEKKVAIKLVRAGLDSEFVLERFKTERQVLAGLEHANIARLLDGGTTDEGLPFFVMEFIEGQPIDEYSDSRQLSIEERLRMFRAVCSAVHYAHQRLLVHRDIKPANILVTAEGTPKLLDFGIAKMLEPEASPAYGAQTVTVFRIMTPEYASPEQFRGEAITTAADVYALGVVLYKLMTGHLPYRLSSRSPHEMTKAVCEMEPEKPSAAIRRREEGTSDEATTRPLTPEQVSSARGTQPDKLARLLAGDLDYILLKAIRKEPQERYASAEQFSEDIERYLQGRPVNARARTWRYRSAKFVRRNKTAMATALFMAAALAAGMVTTIQARRRAERRFNDVRALANSLLFEVHDSIRALPGATAARKLILERAQEYLDRLAADSGSDAALLRELASAYSRLGSVLGNGQDANVGNTDLAIRDYLRAAELREAVLASTPSSKDARRELAEAYTALALVGARAKQQIKAEDYLQKASAILEPLADSYPEDQQIQFDLGKVYERKGQALSANRKWEEAIQLYEKSLEIYQRLADANPQKDDYLVNVAFAHKHVGAVLIVQKQLDGALDHYRSALRIDEALAQADPQDTNKRYGMTFTLSDMGYILAEQGDFNGAMEYYRKVLELRSAMAAADPQDTRARNGLASAYSHMGFVCTKKGNFACAVENDKQAAAISQALSQSDPGSEEKQIAAFTSQAAVGSDLVDEAFQKNISKQQQRNFCSQAEPWMRKGLAGLQQNKDRLNANDSKTLSADQAKHERCVAVLSPQDPRK